MYSASPVRPSYHSGFARCAAESAYPELWNGLVGAWCPGLGPTGGTVYDASHYNADSALTNMELDEWGIGERGWMLTFDPTTDESCNGAIVNPQLDFTTEFAVFGWASIDTLGGANPPDTAVIAKNDVSGGFKGWMLWVSGRKLTAYWNSGVRATGSSNVDDSVWRLYGMQWTTTNAEVWVNTTREANTAATTAPNAATKPLLLGTYQTTGSRTLPGSIATTYAWSGVRSYQEIATLYRDPLAPFRLRRRVAVSVPEAAPAAAPSYLPLLGVG